MNIQKIKIEELRPADYNPRKDLRPTDPEYQKIKKSIEEFGYVDPIIINQDRTVIGGHQRLKVLKEIGFTEVETVVVDLDKDREKALNIALNKISGEWDEEALKELFGQIQNIDAEITGFDRDEIDRLLADQGELTEDDFDVDDAEKSIDKPITQSGDVWQIGRHRLLCGDSTKADDLRILMNGEQAEMIFTDPPYNVDYGSVPIDPKYDKFNRRAIMNDSMTDDQFYRFLFDFYAAALEVTKEGGAIYVCHADLEGANFRQAIKDAGWLLKQCLVWVKSSLVLGRQDYQWKHEPILYGWKPGAAHRWYGGFAETTSIEDDKPVVIEEGERIRIHINNGTRVLTIEVPEYEIKYNGTDETTTIWRFEKPSRNIEHPTMKPVGLVARAIRNSSKIGDAILDCFGGSGTTIIAAEQTNRRAFLCELDPKYCDVIVRRWEEYTGHKAHRITKGSEPDAEATG